jgi:hypothetical protein
MGVLFKELSNVCFKMPKEAFPLGPLFHVIPLVTVYREWHLIGLLSRIKLFKEGIIYNQLDRIVINRDSFEVPRFEVQFVHLQSVVEDRDENDAEEEADCSCNEHDPAFVQVLRLWLHAFVLDEEFPCVNLNGIIVLLNKLLKAIVGDTREFVFEKPLERFDLTLADIRLRLALSVVQIHKHLCLYDSWAWVHVEAPVDFRIPLEFLGTYYLFNLVSIGNDSLIDVSCVRWQYPEGWSLTKVGVLALEG